MKRLLLLLLLFAPALVLAQTPLPQPVIPVPIRGYKGNIIQSDTLPVSGADTLLAITVKAYVTSTATVQGELPGANQPIIVRKGLNVFVRWNNSSGLPTQTFYYKVKIGTQVRFDGTVFISTSGTTPTPKETSVLATVLAQIGGKEPTIVPGTTNQYYRGDKTWQPLNSATVGLGNVNNTSDANKPVSGPQQAALDGKMSVLVIVTNATALLAAATGPTPKLIVCLSDPDFSTDPTINIWDGTNLSVFLTQKRN